MVAVFFSAVKAERKNIFVTFTVIAKSVLTRASSEFSISRSGPGGVFLSRFAHAVLRNGS